jgi:membrane protein required for beta-lactamase induction
VSGWDWGRSWLADIFWMFVGGLMIVAFILVMLAIERWQERRKK